LPKKKENNCSLLVKTACGAVIILVLTVLFALYLSSGGHGTGRTGVSVVREIAGTGDVNLQMLSPMKTKWSHYNDVSLQLDKLSAVTLNGKLLQSESGYETSFKVSYTKKTMTLIRKNVVTNQVEETLYSEKSKTLDPKAVYQFTNKEGTISDSFEAFEKYMESDLLLDTYLISLKLAQFGLTGKSAPVIKGFHTITQTLAKQTDHSKRFTSQMAELVTEINAKIFEEKAKPEQESLLWMEAKRKEKEEDNLFNEKFRYGPCDRYENCTCEIENRSKTCDNACYGLCGPDCDCWAFVCGDCECHCFCFNHDYYCSCISMLDYHCWNIWLWFDACC